MATTEAASDVPRYAPEDPTLPKPWKRMIFRNTMYYWNPETNISQHKRPTPQQSDETAIISAYFRDNSIVRHQLDAFNKFLTKDIQQIVRQSPPIEIFWNHIRTHTITFGKVDVLTPRITEPTGDTNPLLPKEARLRNCTYAAPIYAKVSLEKEGEAATHLDLYIGKVPIMLHSVLCPLQNKLYEELVKAGECAYDPGGYFIINGLEKVIIAQEKMARNRVYVFKKKQPNKYTYVGQIHSMSENQNMPERSLYVRMLAGSRSKPERIRCTLPFIGSDIPIVPLFRALGISSCKNIVQIICHDPCDLEMIELIRHSLKEAKHIKTQEDAIDYIGKLGASDPRNEQIRRRYARDILRREMLPHIGIQDQWEKKKAYFLGYIIHQVLLCALGRRPEDDKYHYGNKRLDLAGPLFGELFRKLFRNLTHELKTYVQKCVDNGKEVNLEVAFVAKTVTKGFNYALATGNWGLKNAADDRVGVSQVLDRLTYLSSLSHLRRANSSIRPEGKVVVKPRQLHTSQWGMMCPFETPVGATCGLVKNLALMAYITVGSDTSGIIEALNNYGLKDIGDSRVTPSTLHLSTKFFVNGDWVGVFEDTNVVNGIFTGLKSLIKKNCYSSIVRDLSRNEIRINTDSGRCCRPLLTVENQRLKVKESLGVLHEESGVWQKLLEKGFVEYIDAEEEETTMISISIKNLAEEKKANGNTYSHCEIHPSLILGVSASMIPFPNHNQSPRNSFQSSMGKQAIGMYAMNYQSRMDTYSSVLCYPQRPLVNTSVMEHLHLKELPAGANAVVAISYQDGYNEGDAIVMNQSSIDRGFLRSLSFRTYKDKKLKGTQFGQPSKEKKISHLDDDGLPSPGTKLPDGSVIIGLSEDLVRSVKTCRGDNGVVDQVMLTTEESTGYSLMKVKTRMVRTPQIGDKFSSRHSQKGVIGMTTSQENMPWTLKGITPDIIINPHSIPSRMTIGQLLESLMGKRLAVRAMKENCVPFTEATVDNIRRILDKCGYQRDGLEKMYDGHTGRPINSLIFTGPVYYQRLCHLVEDKIQSRRHGRVESLTRQPVKGRSRYGGLRFGEMERDSLISHGGSLNLKERLFYQSDPYTAHVCQICGFMGYTRGITFTCGSCKTELSTLDCDQVQIPYAFKLLTQELMSMGIGLSLRTRNHT